jgi:hypothetical protein
MFIMKATLMTHLVDNHSYTQIDAVDLIERDRIGLGVKVASKSTQTAENDDAGQAKGGWPCLGGCQGLKGLWG